MSQHRPFPGRHARPQLPFSWQTWRRCCNASRLGYEASVLGSVYGATRLGPDQELCLQLARAGLADDALTAIRFRGAGIEYSVILPTHRTWKHSRLRESIRAVGMRAVATGRHILIVSPSDVQRQPRLSNAHHIFQKKLVPGWGDAELTTRCIEGGGGEASLVDCEAALASPLARGRVFGLAFAGHVEIDLATELTDRSIVRLKPPGWTFGWDALGWSLLPSASADTSASSDPACAAPGSH